MAAPDISLLGATYPAVSGVELPVDGGGTAVFPYVEGSDTFTQNGTYDVSALAEAVVNVQGSGADTILTGRAQPSGTGQLSLTISNVTKNPKWFAIVLGTNPSSSTNRRITAIMYDGDDIHGGCYRQAGSGSNKTAVYTPSSGYTWAWDSTDNTLTLTSPGSNSGGYFDSTGTPGYYYMIGQ